MIAIALLNHVHLPILQDWRSPARFGADCSIISWIGGKGDRTLVEPGDRIHYWIAAQK